MQLRADTQSDLHTASPVVDVIYFTDPLCSWSWAFEPQWRRLRYEFGPQITWRYVMAGLIPDWQTFHDPMNAISRPVQMGPQWFQVRAVSGMPLDEGVWVEDPPHSSYPACIAVKAATQQGDDAAERYLRAVREAAMLTRQNVGRWEVLCEAAESAGLDAAQFEEDLNGLDARHAFREDLRSARDREIGRFPSLALRVSEGHGVLIVGYRPYDILLAALHRVAPGITPVRSADDALAYVRYWGSATVPEVAEALQVSREDAGVALENSVRNGDLRTDNRSSRFPLYRAL